MLLNHFWSVLGFFLSFLSYFSFTKGPRPGPFVELCNVGLIGKMFDISVIIFIYRTNRMLAYNKSLERLLTCNLNDHTTEGKQRQQCFC